MFGEGLGKRLTPFYIPVIPDYLSTSTEFAFDTGIANDTFSIELDIEQVR